MSDVLRLLVLTHNYPRYKGDHAGVFLALLMRQLAGFNIQPIVIAPHDQGAAEQEEDSGVKVYRFRYAEREESQTLAYRGDMHRAVLSPRGLNRFMRFLTSFRQKATAVMQQEPVDAVWGHWLVPTGMVMQKLVTRQPLPMILSSHGTDIRLMSKYHGLPYRYFAAFCRKLRLWMTVSNFLKQAIVQMDRGVEPIVKVLPLPHDESLFYADSHVPSEPDLVVAVTRFTDQKRVGHLLRAFSRVVRSRPSAKLAIHGSGPLEEAARHLISDINLAESVSIAPPVSQSELRQVYNRASVVILNSYREGFGLVLSEAMLCGTAVIGSDSGGIPDIIEHEKRGLLVPVDDVESLAAAILRLLNDGQLRLRLAENGHSFAQEQYASGPLSKKYAELLREAVGK